MTPVWISDPTDERLADYRQLNRPRRRDRCERAEGRFVAEGIALVERLLATPHPIRSLLLTPEKFRRLEHLAAAVPAPVYVAERGTIESIVGFDLHRGAIASADRLPRPDLDDLLGEASSVALLEGINDHENLGAIFRSAAALGVAAMLLDSRTPDPYQRRVVRVSMGAALTLPFAVLPGWPDSIARLHAAGFTTIALTPDPSAMSIGDVDVPERPCVLLGSEAAGLSAPAREMARQRVRIPIGGGVNSLNVGHAAAVAFHHFR